MRNPSSRRSFFQTVGLGAAAPGLRPTASAAEKPIPGFEKAADDPNASKGWKPVSDRKIRVGIVAHQSALQGGALLKIPQFA